MRPTCTNVFIVDDDRFWSELLGGILTDMGVSQVSTFSTSEDCLKNLHLNPDLIFTDYQMEELNGLELLKMIKMNNHHSQVVFCTAHEDLSVACNAIKYGSMDYFLKSNLNRYVVEDILKSLRTTAETV